MTMASRDIANMHTFLDLKKKFPDLPDETLRSYISLYAEDQDKCINLLQKESANHYHPSQQFSDFRLSDMKPNSRKTDNVKSSLESLDENFYSSALFSPLQHPELSSGNKIQIPSGRSTSHAGVVHMTGKLLKPELPSRPESHSAPIVTNNEHPFRDIYKVNPVSSHIPTPVILSDREKYSPMMFSTTKEHMILPPPIHESSAYLPICSDSEQSKRHAVKLSITPTFPFQQQHINVFNNSVCATASHSSRPGRHTTSLNFQLQPQSSNQYPLEISTIPTNIGSSCNSKDFGSHVQISVGSQGATFTALRLQRPTYSQSRNAPHLVTAEEFPEGYTSSSQAQNSSVYLFPNRVVQPLTCSTINEDYSRMQDDSQRDQRTSASTKFNSKIPSVQSYQISPEYILAVKNHQIAQLDLILEELEKEKFTCSQLKAEVRNMELQVTQRNSPKISSLYTEELNKLRDENRKLRIECNCLLMEVDMCSTGQIPLGVTDEDFYSNIFTGPNDAVSSPTVKAPPKADENPSTTTKKSSFEDDEDDERNRWKCKECTFANHPALEKCEICELPKSLGSFFAEN